jgi:hypothetical protein
MPGGPGRAAATRVIAEPPGGPCPAGGWRVDSGLDDSGDGVLDDDEVEATTYLCRGRDGTPATPVIEGTVVITSDVDVAGLAGVEEITGDLRFEGIGLRAVELTDLRRVGGTVWLRAGIDLAILSLPALREVGALVVDAPSVLTSLSAPLLETAHTVRLVVDAPALDLSALRTAYTVRVTGRLPDLRGLRSLESVTALFAFDGLDATVSLVGLERLRSAGGVSLRGLALAGPSAIPALTSVIGTLTIAACRGSALSLPSLASATAIEVTGTHLDGVSLDGLRDVPALTVTDNPALGFLRAPLLAGADDSSLTVARAPVLHELQLPALRRLAALYVAETGLDDMAGLAALEVVTGDLVVNGNRLTKFELPALRSVATGFFVQGNAELARFSLPAIEAMAHDFVVTSSPALCRSQVQAAVDRLLARGWTGLPSLVELDDQC